MKKSILFSIIFAVLAVFFAYTYLSNLETTYRSMSEPVSVVTASQRIAQGTVIKREMLVEKKVPKEYAQPKVFAGINNLFTKDGASAYISLNTIEAGEQIMSTKVSRTNSETGITNIIPEGYKALAVNFDSESAGIMTPGSRIDVLSIIEYEDKGNKHQESIYMIAQNILVLAVGDNYLGSAPKKEDKEYSSRNNATTTLAVTVDEAQTIMLAADRGTLKYIIRPAGDNDIYDVKPMKISDIVKDISAAAVSRKRHMTAEEKEMMKMMYQSGKDVSEMLNKYVDSKNR